MLTIRNNIFETNSSSTHSYVYDLSNNFVDHDAIIEQLKIKNGILIINGSNESSQPICTISSIRTKLSLIATAIVANDDKNLQAIFEETIVEYLPEIKKFKYNVILAGKRRNASFNPNMMKACFNYDSKCNESSLKLAYLTNKKLNKILLDKKYMKMFLFGKTSMAWGMIEFV